MNFRILYLGVNRFYLNKNTELFSFLLKSSFHADFYGPGYKSNRILDKGIKYYLDKKEPYNFVITEAPILFFDGDINSIPFHSYNYFKKNSLKKHISDMLNWYKESKENKIFFGNVDYYYLRKKEIDILNDINPYIISRDLEFWRPISKMPDIVNEYFYTKITDNWYNFIENKQDRIISLPGIIAENEFKYHPLNDRKYDVTIPGANYHYRIQAKKILSKEKDLKKLGKLYNLFRKINNKIYFHFPHKFNTSIVQYLFKEELESSKTCFTCGSGLGYPIRKFLEIPASGTLLICKPFFGYNNFGYDEHNSVIIQNINEVAESVRYYKNNIDLAQRLATNGQNMIMKNHSLGARKLQIINVFSSIYEKKFAGSKWKKGNFIINEK